jgi:hypothetical protein
VIVITPEMWNIAGTIVNSLSALGTLGALIMAVVVYRRAEDDKRREQASKITVMASPFKRQPDTDGEGKVAEGALQVTNHSDLPVYSIRASFGVVYPIAVRHGHYDMSMHSVGPGETRSVKLKSTDEQQETLLPQASLLFIDAAGRYWFRLDTGHLYEVSPESMQLKKPLWLGRVMRRY